MENAQRVVLTLLSERSDAATLCPSEVARTLAGQTDEPAGWRQAMPAVHDAVDRLLAAGEIRLSWKGRTLPARKGPYRIGRPEARTQ